MFDDDISYEVVDDGYGYIITENGVNVTKTMFGVESFESYDEAYNTLNNYCFNEEEEIEQKMSNVKIPKCTTVGKLHKFYHYVGDVYLLKQVYNDGTYRTKNGFTVDPNVEDTVVYTNEEAVNKSIKQRNGIYVVEKRRMNKNGKI